MNYYNYFTEIEETFIRRRGRNLLLSPLDWALIEDWQERKIPLHVAIRSIESVFDVYDKQPVGTRSIKSLFYCREEVESQFAEWTKMQVGRDASEEAIGSSDAASDTFSEDAITSHLDNVTNRLMAAADGSEDGVRSAIERVLERLAELRQSRESNEHLEQSLEHLDAVIDESLLKSQQVLAAAKIVTSQMSAYKVRMDAEAYRRTFDLMVIKRLREQADVPRLSLYYL
ncbi:MAG: hypothetical protein WBD22_00105 [Pyrinomonadaceae bacterium]